MTNQLVGGARGAVTSFGISDPPSGIATPDGSVNAVGYTFDPLVFEWGGLDTTATWGGVQGRISLRRRIVLETTRLRWAKLVSHATPANSAK